MIRALLLLSFSFSALLGQTSCEFAPNPLCRSFCNSFHTPSIPSKHSCCSLSQNDDGGGESGNANGRPHSPKPCDCPDDCPLKHPPEYTVLRSDVERTSAIVADGFDLPTPAIAIASHGVEGSISLGATRVMTPFVSTTALLYAHHKLRC